MVDWFFSKIKYFFWSSVASGAVMVGSAFSPTLQHKINENLRAVQKAAKENAPKLIADRIPEVSSPVQAMQTTEALGVKRVSASNNEYVVDDKHYVLIEGKYYLAREDNTYMVNGRKVFYVNKRERELPQDSKKTAEIKGGLDATGSAAAEGEEIGIPTSPQEMIETLKKAQQQMKERNKALNEMEH